MNVVILYDFIVRDLVLIIDLIYSSGSISFLLFLQASENKEELKTKLKGILREKSDAFNSENPEEDKV